MRIGVITGEFPPMQGGVGDFSFALTRELARMGHEIYVLTSHKASPPVQQNGITIRPTVEQWGRWGKQVHSVPRGLQQAKDWVRHHQLDVVNIQYQAAAYNMHLAANHLPNHLRHLAKVVTSFHDLREPYLFPKAGPLRKRALYAMARQSHGVIITNRPDEQELLAAGHMPPLARIPIGSNIAVAPPADYDRLGWRNKYAIPPDALLVGFFGFINKTKGVDTLAQAVRLLSNGTTLQVHLLIIGGQTGDSDETNLAQADIAQEMISGLGIAKRVHWTGFVTAEEVSANLMACDVIALPFKDGVSLRRGTLIAALAHGCPIVTTFPTEDDPALVDGYAMRMVQPDQPAQLAEMIKQIFQSADQRQSLSQNAMHLAQRFRWDTIARETSDFFYSLFS